MVALGIVYGDIGTSPLYAFKQAAQASGTLSPETILGLASLIMWTLVLVVSLKYAILIMRADNHGEGCIVALLDVRHAPRGSWRASLLIIGLVGAALFYGDGVSTPAHLGAERGRRPQIASPALAPAVIPLSILILVGLFVVQRKGTAFIGNIFGPLMLLWFLAIQLGFLPRMRVLHTASHEQGQIYMPIVNRLLAAGTLGAVLMFGSSDALGGAYGIAVSMLMAITMVLAALVARQWGYNPFSSPPSTARFCLSI